MARARPRITSCATTDRVRARVPQRPVAPASRFAIGAALALVPVAGCGEDSVEDWPEGRPRIDVLTFEQQLPGDPWALDFALQFTDTDGDLGQGRLRLSLADNERSVLPLEEVFAAQTPPVARDATGGRLTVVVRLEEQEVRAGDELRFTFVLEDGQGRRSNAPWIVLRVLSGGGT